MMSGPMTLVRRLTGPEREQWLHATFEGHRAFVVASPAALRRVGLRGPLPGTMATFSDFTPNPSTVQAREAARERERHGAELVVGIGGGSAMDVAKAAAALPADPGRAADVLARRARPDASGPRLVLVPTTAGTGSEVTCFATLYEHTRKLSLDDARCRADEACIDPELLRGCPPHVLWCGALDTVAHAIESLWSMRSDPTSRHSAVAALEQIAPVLADARRAATVPGRDALSRAGTLAGRAIDRTRTTAAHALAYPLTAHLGLAHGLACAVNLRWLVGVVACPAPDTVLDPRGPAAPRGAVDAAARALGVDGPEGVAHLVDAVLARCRPPSTTLARAALLLDCLVEEGLASERVGGTPVALTREQVRMAMGDSLVGLLGYRGKASA
jgi:alcohol dehydrogenase